MLKLFAISFSMLMSHVLFAQPHSFLDDAPIKALTVDALVTTQWLSEHLDDPDLIILDCTVLMKLDENGDIYSESGRAAYDMQHIPNAGFADLITELSDPDSNFDFWMPSAAHFANAMSALGVGDDSRIVLYGSSDPLAAARVWWMLRWIGHDAVAILDGGLSAWKKEGRATSSEPVVRPRNTLTIALRPELIANHRQVRAAIEDNNVVLVDALPGAHYRGEFALYPRAGHITSAINMPTSEQTDGNYFRSYDELDLMFDDNRSNKTITYCGGGIAASSLAFNMHRLGFSNVSVYMGSLQEWAANPSNPMTIDSP